MKAGLRTGQQKTGKQLVRKTERKAAPTGIVYLGRSPSKIQEVKGVVVMQPQEDDLIALLDAGKVDEFRLRMNASRLERRKHMYARVMSSED